MKPSNAYISAVLQKLIDEPMEAWFGNQKDGMILPVSEVVIVPPDTKHPNYPKTVEAIKYIIDEKMDRLNGFEITFNNSYEKFKKTIYIKPNKK